MKRPEARARHLFVSGFGAFGDVTFNPSGAIAQSLQESPPAGWSVSSVQLPVTFEGAPQSIEQALASQTHTPTLLLGLGVHPGRTFRLERRARSLLVNARADNDGKTNASIHDAADGHVIERVTNLDLRALALCLCVAGGGAVTLSNDAGQYVCERAYLQLLALGQSRAINALFLHVPPEHVMPFASQAAIVRAWLAACADVLC